MNQPAFQLEGNRGHTERLASAIADHVAELLGVASVETSADLWALGFDSLGALRLVQWLYAEHGVPVRADTALYAGTAAAIAMLATEGGLAELPRSPAPSGTTAEAAVPTEGQTALWLDSQIRPEQALGNVVLFGYRMRGEADPDRLFSAVRQVVRRHDALRTGIAEDTDGMPAAVEISEDHAVRLRVVESTGANTSVCAEAMARSLDVAAGPLMTVELRRGDGWTDLVAAVAHTAFDGHSEALFTMELSALLRGEEPAPVRSFRDTCGVSAADRTGLADWTAELAGTGVLSWPGQPSWDGGSRYGRLRCDLDEAARHALEASARAAGLTPFVMALQRFGRALRAVTGASSYRVGVPTAGRDDPATHNTIGYFLREAVVPLRDRELDGPPTAAMETWRRAARWSAVPPSDLVREVRRAGGQDPLFTVQFIWQNTIPAKWDVPGLHIEALDIPPVAPQNDLSLELWPTPDGRVRGVVEYDRKVVPTSVAAAVHARFLAELAELAVLDGPVSAGQHADIGRSGCVWQQVARHAALAGDRIALRANGAEVTYRDLMARATRFAAHLSRRMDRPGELIGIALPSSEDAIVAMLAAMMSGGAFVPLDPEFPAERLAAIVDDARLRFVIDESEMHAENLIVPGWSPPVASGDPDALACVYYTSGSTGRPRGVMMPHKPLAAYVRNLVRDWRITHLDRFLQFSSLVWATSGEEIFSCLTAGATLVVEPTLRYQPVSAFLSFVAENEITILDLPTVFWREVTEFLYRSGTALPPSVRLVVIGGDNLDRQSVRKWRSAGTSEVRLVNTYGSTEFGLALQADVDADPPPAAPLPIGRPLPGIVAYVDGRPYDTLPPGTTGELAIGGTTVTRGYLHDAKLTAERFQRDEEGHRRFRTRDIVRVGEDGVLEFVGRADRQAKVRGNRVDLTEIEAILEDEADVARAVAVPLTAADGQTRLVALVVIAGEEPDVTTRLRVCLLRLLPAFAVPDRIFTVVDLPLLASGKKDLQRAHQIAVEMAGS